MNEATLERQTMTIDEPGPTAASEEQPDQPHGDDGEPDDGRGADVGDVDYTSDPVYSAWDAAYPRVEPLSGPPPIPAAPGALPVVEPAPSAWSVGPYAVHTEHVRNPGGRLEVQMMLCLPAEEAKALLDDAARHLSDFRNGVHAQALECEEFLTWQQAQVKQQACSERLAALRRRRDEAQAKLDQHFAESSADYEQADALALPVGALSAQIAAAERALPPMQGAELDALHALHRRIREIVVRQFSTLARTIAENERTACGLFLGASPADALARCVVQAKLKADAHGEVIGGQLADFLMRQLTGTVPAPLVPTPAPLPQASRIAGPVVYGEPPPPKGKPAQHHQGGEVHLPLEVIMPPNWNNPLQVEANE